MRIRFSGLGVRDPRVLLEISWKHVIPTPHIFPRLNWCQEVSNSDFSFSRCCWRFFNSFRHKRGKSFFPPKFLQGSSISSVVRPSHVHVRNRYSEIYSRQFQMLVRGMIFYLFFQFSGTYRKPKLIGEDWEEPTSPMLKQTHNLRVCCFFRRRIVVAQI